LLIGLLSDAHGNALGLSACLNALHRRGVEQIYFLGDAVGYLPGEVEVLDLLGDEGVLCQRGNHEAMLLGDLELDPVRDEAYGLAAARRRLRPDQIAELKSWPDIREFEASGHRVVLAHGSPRSYLTDYVYPDADVSWLGDLGYDAVFMGNTHRPFATRVGGVLVANVGSCGLPRDQGDLAACVAYDSDLNSCEILRIPVPAASVMAQFSSPVHPLVTDCLHRRAASPVGTIVSS
jgi:predicted phosphodiesterase